MVSRSRCRRGHSADPLDREQRRRELPLHALAELGAHRRGLAGRDRGGVRGRERHAPLGLEGDHLRAEPAELAGRLRRDRHRRALELEVVDRRQRDHRLVEDRADGADQAGLLLDRAGAQQLQRAGRRLILGLLARGRGRRERQLDALGDADRRLQTVDVSTVVTSSGSRRDTGPQVDLCPSGGVSSIGVGVVDVHDHRGAARARPSARR
jgi:hypothetical protein